MKYTQKLILIVLLSTTAISFDMPFKIEKSETGGLVYNYNGKADQGFYKFQVHGFYLSGDVGKFGVDVSRVADGQFHKDTHLKEGLTNKQEWNDALLYSSELYEKFKGHKSWVVDGDASYFTAFKAVEFYNHEKSAVEQIILWNEKSNRYELIKKGSSSGEQIEFTDGGIKVTNGGTILIDVQQHHKLQQLFKKNDPKKLNAGGQHISQTQAHHTEKKPEVNNEGKPQVTPSDPVKPAEDNMVAKPIEQTHLLNAGDNGEGKPKEHSEKHHTLQAEIKPDSITDDSKSKDGSVVSDHNVTQTEIKLKEHPEDKPKEHPEDKPTNKPNDKSIIRFDNLSNSSGFLPLVNRGVVPEEIEIKWNSDSHKDFDIIAYNKDHKGHLSVGIYQIKFIPGDGGNYKVILTNRFQSSYVFNGKSEIKLEELTSIFKDKWAILKGENNSLTVFKGVRAGNSDSDVVYIRNPLTNEIQTFNPKFDGEIDPDTEHSFDNEHLADGGEKSGDIIKRKLLKDLNEMMKKSKGKKRRFLK
jgi:hypothetical protein